MAFTAEATREEMRAHVGNVVALAPADSRKAALAFAAKVLRLSPARVKKLFYGEPITVHAHEADQVRAYVEQAQQIINARAAYEAERQAFLADHPALARLAPRALPRTQAIEEAEQAVADKRRA